MNLLFAYSVGQSQNSLQTRLSSAQQSVLQSSESNMVTGLDTQNQQQKVPGNSVGMGLNWWSILPQGLYPYTAFKSDSYVGVLAQISIGIKIFIVLMNILAWIELYLLLFNKKNP